MSRLKFTYFLFYFIILVIQHTTSWANTIKPDKKNQKSDFWAGAASYKITPPVGSIMGNSYGITISEGVHDDLFAKALVFELNGTKAVFIALDLISIPHVIIVRTRDMIAESTGIPSNHIIMTATHVHAGPQMNPLFINAVGGLAKQKSEQYLENLPAMIAQSVKLANEKIQPARVYVGKVHEDAISFNRRFKMKNGSFQMNPGSFNPDIVRSAGPIDSDVYVVYFETLDSKPLATLVNFALHPAIAGGNLFSADFPGKLAELLSKVKGEEMVTLFSNGNSGNINHIDVLQTNQFTGQKESFRIATILTADVMKAFSSLHLIEPNTMHIHTMEVELPAPVIKPEEFAWAQEIIGRYGNLNSPPFNHIVQAWKIIDLGVKEWDESRYQSTTTIPLVKGGGALKSEIQVIAIGDELALVGFPGDAFVELGLTIKQNSPFPYTIVNEQSGNGTISYIPNRKAFSEGGYEAESARILPGGGEILVDAVIRTLIDLYPYNANQTKENRQ